MKADIQGQIVRSRGRNIVVSASAGCGKTTTMIRRIAELIKDGVDIKSMLIVTFTNASAKDMKDKLRTELSKSAAQPFISRQLRQLERADISTIDSFCTRLLRDNFAAAGIDPSFEILSAEDSDLMRLKILDKLIAERTLENSADFAELAEAFSEARGNRRLAEAVLELCDFVSNLPDSDEYLSTRIFASLSPDLSKNPSYIQSTEYISESFKGFASRLSSLGAELERLGLEKDAWAVGAYLSEIAPAALKRELWDTTEYLQNMGFPRLSGLPKDAKGNPECKIAHDRLKELTAEIKTAVKEFLKYFGCGSQEELLENMAGGRRLAAALAALTRDFSEAYAAEKRERAALDFSDLCRLSIKLLEDGLSEVYRERYKYVFVDESQDINSLQSKLIDCIRGENNLFSVGDLKQCIYRFRGAEPELFHRKCEAAKLDPQSELFRLSQNYRTNTRILDYVNDIFSSLMLPEFSLVDYKRTDMLYGETAARIEPGEPVEIRTANSCSKAADEESELGAAEASEGAAVCEAITELVSFARIDDPKLLEARLREGKTDRVSFSDIAVLVRGRNSSVRAIFNLMKTANIPVSAEFEGTLSEYKEIIMLINYLELADNFRQDIPLAAVLRSHLGQFSDAELARIRKGTAHKFFHEAFEVYAQSGEDESLRNKCAAFIQRLAKYSFAASYVSASELLGRIIVDFDYEAALLGSPGGSEKCAALKSFLSSIEDKAYSRTLYDFLLYCRTFGSKLRIKTAPPSSFDCVKLTTMHKSKGLEYPVVILCGLSQGFNLTVNRFILFDKDLGAGIDGYDFLRKRKKHLFAYSLIRYRLRETQIKEELNTLYVAMTRPKYKLIIVSDKAESKLESLSGAADIKRLKNFIDPILLLTPPEIPVIPCGTTDFSHVKHIELVDRPNAYTEDVRAGFNAEYAFSSALRVKLKHTVTELTKRQRAVYGGEDISFAASSVEKGDAYHRLLELIDLEEGKKGNVEGEIFRLKAEGKLSEDEAALIDCSDIHRFFAAAGEHISENVYREKAFMLYVPESDLGGGSGEKVLVQGKIDLLSVGEKGVKIIDYKMSSHSDEALLRSYSGQINAYALAVEKILGSPVLGKYIYSFASGNLISVG